MRLNEFTTEPVAIPRKSKYFSIADTSENGSTFTRLLFHCFNVLHCGCRTRLHFN